MAALVVALALLWAPAARAQTAQLETPRQTLESFLRAGTAGEFAQAAETLDLHLIRADQRRGRGPELAEQLFVVLRRAVWIDVDLVPDEPLLEPGMKKTYRVATVPLGGRDVPLMLAMTVVGKNKDPRWLWSSGTVSLIPKLFDQYGPGVIESRLPPSVRLARFGRLAVWQWVGITAALPIGYGCGHLIAWLARLLGRRVVKRTRAQWDNELVESLYGATRLSFALLVFRVLLEPLTLPAAVLGGIGTVLKVGFIGALGFAAVATTGVVSKTIEAHAAETAEANDSVAGVLHARGIATQVRVLQRVLNITISVLVLALMLLQFETVRNVGMSLLASAGLAGVVLGLATQRTIGSLIAGIQLSLTQPIRIGDAVVIEREWGVIEEITLTYVVVRIWDERRLIVPMTRFLDQPFENWTKEGSQLHGTVMLYVDPAMPMAPLRAEIDRAIEGDPRWDGRTKTVRVTDSDPRSMTIRVLVSADNAGDLFELRASVRERMLGWLASFEGGKYLVRMRIEERSDAAVTAVAAP